MAPSYPLGTIPPLSVWEGDSLSFTVTNPKTDGAKFSVRATPIPKGKLSLDENTGVFFYQAAREDRDEFSVTIRHGDKSQSFPITPQPRLASDFHVIKHVSAPPAQDSRLYITYSEEDAGRAIFNNQADYQKESDVEIDTKRVTVAGVKLVLERSTDPSALYQRLNGRTDLRELTLCADEVVIGSELKLPGTEVSIYARVLTFKGAGQINTTPLSVQTRPPREATGREEGLRGQKGGDVHLLFGELNCPPTGTLVITNGGKGQPAREGVEGDRGKSYKQWDGRYLAKAGVAGEKWFDWSGEIKQKTGDYVPVTAEIWRINKLAAPTKVTCIIDGGVKDKGDAMKEVPTSGSPPKVYPGFPGHGGDGGKVMSSQIERFAARFEMDAGASGDMAQNVKASPAGQPSKWSVMKITYNPQVIDPDMELGGVLQMFHNRNMETQDGPPGIAPGPNPNTPAARRGQPRGPNFDWEWIHPLTVRAFISYARDLMLSGHTENLKSLLTFYERCLEEAVRFGGFRYKGDNMKSHDQLLAATLNDEVSSLIQRIDGPYDYFGNPAGWVPMLSFQTNMKLFEAEVDVALRVMFLAHWVESKENRERKAATALTKAAERLREESTKALADYQAAYNKLDDLEDRAIKTTGELETCAKDLARKENDLRSKVKDDLKLEHILRSSGKVLGGVMQLIPAGQPVLGAFGKSLTALSDIDLDDPTASASKIASPIAIVAGQKLKEKATKLYDELKSAKDNEEKEKDEKEKKFDEKVAEADLKERVATHRKEQQAAKDSIIDALSGFTVSEDDIEERLEKILADSPGYQEIVEEVKRLNTKKAALTEELLSVLDTIDQATTTILKNQFALIKVRAQLDTKVGALNPQLRQYVQGMGQRARDRLLHYQYYMVKSYHYLMLEDVPAIDYRSQKLVDAFVPMLADSPDGSLTASQFNSLKAVFDDQLQQVGKQIIDFYQSHTARNTATLPVSLSRKEVETLNAQGQVDIDLLRWLNPQREDLRLTGVETLKVTLAGPLPSEIVGFSLEYRHDGISKIRRGGKLYLFRSGQYRIAAGKGEPTPDQYRNDKVFWASDCTYLPPPSPETEKGEVKVTETEVSKEEESLVRHLIKGNLDEKNPLLSFQPAAWTRLRITKSGTYRGKIDKLTLKLNMLFHKVDDRLSTVVVRTGDDIEPFIRCEPLDRNESGDGYGTFIRTYDVQRTGKVKLRAPLRYGQRAFTGWLIGERDPNSQGPPPLIKEPLLTLDMKKRDYLVEPVYEADEFVPVVDNDQWPPCPTGWKFVDWEFKNGVNVPITINRLDWTPFDMSNLKGYVPAVNEPQGTEQVKISFDRLQLMPGETARISVCTNPASPADAQPHIMFNWLYKDVPYAVIFDGQAKFSMFRKFEHERWHQSDTEYAIDTTNRLVTFRG